MLAAGAGCAKAPVVVPLAAPEAPIRLGWRWLPGQALTYRSSVVRTVGPVVFTRVETWRYLATDLNSSGIIQLTGTQEAMGTRITADGEDVDPRRLDAVQQQDAAASPTSVDVQLRMSGRIVGCSAEGFGEALPHHLLGLHLPTEPVLPDDSWDEGGVIRAFQPVVPVQVDVTTFGQATLSQIDPVDAGWRLQIAHDASIGLGALGPFLRARGSSTWDTDPGTLHSRSLHARWTPETAHGAPIGQLDITLERVDA